MSFTTTNIRQKNVSKTVPEPAPAAVLAAIRPPLQVKIKFIDGHKLHLRVKPWCTIKDVKNQLSQIENIPTRNMRIFFRGAEVDNNWPLTLQENKTALFCVIGGDFQKGLGSTKNGTTSGEPSPIITGSASPYQPRASLEIRGTSSDCAPVLVEAMREAQKGLRQNLKPILADDGSGGTYFLRNSSKEFVAVFKPKDEEPGAINNPRGYVGVHGQIAAHRGIYAGQGCDRELAAYLLDHDDLAGVPPTALAEAVHPSFHQDRLHNSNNTTTTTTTSNSTGNTDTGNTDTDNKKNADAATVSTTTTSTITPVKVGILQQFVHADDVAGNLSNTMFDTEDVHRIALLDMRLLNTDRNDSNILVLKKLIEETEGEQHGSENDNTDYDHNGEDDDVTGNNYSDHSTGSYNDTEDDDYNRYSYSSFNPSIKKTSKFKLVPIDHGYCLPQTLNIGWCDWCWLGWKNHMDAPLSAELRAYVDSLDAEKDAFRLSRETSIGPLCLKNMKIALMLLKTGVQSELTLGDIASLMVRNDVDLDIPSELEVAVSRASALAESMVRSPRMRGYSYNSTSPTPPHSPTKKYGTPSPSGKLIRSSSPVSPTLLGAPALSVECVESVESIDSTVGCIDTKKSSPEDEKGRPLPVKLTRRSTRRLSDRLLNFDSSSKKNDNVKEDDLKNYMKKMKNKKKSNSLTLQVPQHQEDDCKHASPKHADQLKQQQQQQQVSI